MKLDLYTLGQYTDNKKYYITRLSSISPDGTMISYFIKDGMATKKKQWLYSKNAIYMAWRQLVNWRKN
jgi:prolyl oligopeptidase PreP (S9A serine peptidase family)